MNSVCKSLFCRNSVELGQDYCPDCSQKITESLPQSDLVDYDPQEFKKIEITNLLDTFCVHQAFGIQDPSGCLQHASRLILLSNNDIPSLFENILEARDTLTRWLALNKTTKHQISSLTKAQLEYQLAILENGK